MARRQIKNFAILSPEDTSVATLTEIAAAKEIAAATAVTTHGK